MPIDLFTALPEHGDKRVLGWPLLGNVRPTLAITGAYVFFIIFGRMWMKTRKPFGLRNLMLFYNILQVIFCSFITYEAAYVWITQRYRFLCQPVDYSYSPMALRTSGVCWWFYIMKLVDLLDTVIFVLRKKDDQITFLHVYHHLTMVYFVWWGARNVAGGHAIFIAIVNSFIHVIMYAYYGLSACGPRVQKYLWWKRYLTQAQIVQFIAVIGHSGLNFFTPCHFPKIFDLGFLTYGMSILLLFCNFYIQSYIKKRRVKKQA